MFNLGAHNTFSPIEAQRVEKIAGLEKIGEKWIETIPLNEIFEIHLPPNQTIDFIDIDVEGLDMEVIISNDWNKYRSQLILVESIYTAESIESVLNCEMHRLMNQIDYKLIGKLWNTLIYKNNRK